MAYHMSTYMPVPVYVPPVVPAYKGYSRDKGTGAAHPFKHVLDKALKDKAK